jgi:Trypsin-like peptidase domain
MKRGNLTRVIAAGALVLALVGVVVALLVVRENGDEGAATSTDRLVARAAKADESGAPRGRGATAEPPSLEEFQDLMVEAERQEMKRFTGAPGTGEVPSQGSTEALGKGTPGNEIGHGETPPGGRSAAQELKWAGWPRKPMPQVGRMVMREADGSVSACSGTVVGPDLVATAAHCVYSQELGRYHSAIVFVPGMTWKKPADPRNIKTPYGIWQGAGWWAPNGYRAGAADYDWGLVQLEPLGGRDIGDVVGARRVQANIDWGRGIRVQAVGYPAAGFWATRKGHYGNGQYVCDSTWDGDWERTLNDHVIVAIDCTMNGGASGGPWFVRLKNGQWVIGGVNDFCHGPHMNDPRKYCTPTSDQVKSVLFDGDYASFWNSVLNQLP